MANSIYGIIVTGIGDYHARPSVIATYATFEEACEALKYFDANSVVKYYTKKDQDIFGDRKGYYKFAYSIIDAERRWEDDKTDSIPWWRMRCRVDWTYEDEDGWWTEDCSVFLEEIPLP